MRSQLSNLFSAHKNFRRVLSICLIFLYGMSSGQDKPEGRPTVQVRGIVLDSSGKAMQDVEINHLTEDDTHVMSQRDGRFRFETYAPAVVFRKKGYESQLQRIPSHGGYLRVVLQMAADPEPLPVCERGARCSLILEDRGFFCLAKVDGVQENKGEWDTDAFEKQFIVHTPSGFVSMTHGAGTSWGNATPPSWLVWRSVEFREKRLLARDQVVIDSRGVSSDGKISRHFGVEGQTVFYGDVEPAAASLFDRVIDGICIAPEEEQQ